MRQQEDRHRGPGRPRARPMSPCPVAAISPPPDTELSPQFFTGAVADTPLTARAKTSGEPGTARTVRREMAAITQRDQIAQRIVGLITIDVMHLHSGRSARTPATLAAHHDAPQPRPAAATTLTGQPSRTPRR